MAHRKGDALPQQGLYHLLKAAELPHGKGVPRLTLVGHGEVGEDALGIQPRQSAGGFHLLHGGLVPADVLEVEAQAAHAGVDFHVDIHRGPGLHRVVGELLGVLQAVHALGNPVLRQGGGLLGGRVAQHQHGPGDAPQPQLQGLLQVGDGEPVRAQSLKLLGHAHRPVAVGVRLDNTAHLGVFVGGLAHRGKVPGQGVQVDFRPGSSQYFFHTHLPPGRCFTVLPWQDRGLPGREGKLAGEPAPGGFSFPGPAQYFFHNNDSSFPSPPKGAGKERTFLTKGAFSLLS